VSEGYPPYGTHIPALVAALMATTGPVLELGSGNLSTPLLHAVSFKRPVETVEHDRRWGKRFEAMATDRHAITLIDDWSEWCDRAAAKKWDVVLLDCEPWEIRIMLAEYLRDMAKLIVVHDSEQAMWNGVLDTFKYRRTDRSMLPNTAIVSDTMEVPHFGLEAPGMYWYGGYRAEGQLIA